MHVRFLGSSWHCDGMGWAIYWFSFSGLVCECGYGDLDFSGCIGVLCSILNIRFLLAGGQVNGF